MPIEVIWVALAIAAVVAALAVLAVAVALWRLASETRAAVRSAARLLEVLEAELPPTVGHLRDLTTRLDELSTQLPPRLERLDALLDESDVTLAAVRASAEAAEHVVRMPLEVADRLRRTLRRGAPAGHHPAGAGSNGDDHDAG